METIELIMKQGRKIIAIEVSRDELTQIEQALQYALTDLASAGFDETYRRYNGIALKIANLANAYDNLETVA